MKSVARAVRPSTKEALGGASIRRGDLKTRYFFFPRKEVAVKQSAGKGMRNV
jgi:hypothetical protein